MRGLNQLTIHMVLQLLVQDELRLITVCEVTAKKLKAGPKPRIIRYSSRARPFFLRWDHYGFARRRIGVGAVASADSTPQELPTADIHIMMRLGARHI
jgi:hypothetical protein